MFKHLASARLQDAGIANVCPTFNLRGSSPGFAAISDSTLMLYFLAMDAGFSPDCTRCERREIEEEVAREDCEEFCELCPG